MWLLLPLLLAFGCAASAAPHCASSVTGLRSLVGDPQFPLRWQETTMDDGKPLQVTIREQGGALFLKFTKTSEGLFAEGSGRICEEGGDLETDFNADRFRMGPAANWLARYAMGHGTEFTLTRLGPSRLRIETTGWKGTFSPVNQAALN